RLQRGVAGVLGARGVRRGGRATGRWNGRRDRRAAEDPARGLERGGAGGGASGPPLARRRAALLLCSQLRGGTSRSCGRRGDDGVRRSLRERRFARARLRLPVSPGEEPARGHRAAGEVRGVVIVVPAIDLLGGNAVRLRQGRYDDVTVYDEDPAGRACGWRGKVPLLHVVDLEGAKAGALVQREAVGAILRA